MRRRGAARPAVDFSGHADRGLRPDCAAPARCLCPSGAGRYSGLSIRKQPKTSVTGRQVDGPLDRSRSVAIVDDSIVSGMSLEASIRALENDGFEVEGVVALVRFPNRGGIPWAWSNGLSSRDALRHLGRPWDGRAAVQTR